MNETALFDFSFALSILPQIVQGFWVALQVAMGGMVLAVIIGLIFELLRRTKIIIVEKTVQFLIEFLRSTPLLVQVYFLYYVGPEAGITLPALMAGVIALGFHYSAYMAEVYRAGINSLSKGQWEAAKALNFTPYLTWKRIIIPQVVPLVIPTMVNYWIAILKDTPLLSAITVVELLQTAKLIGAETFRYFEPITLVGIIFLIIGPLSGKLGRMLEEKFNYQT